MLRQRVNYLVYILMTEVERDCRRDSIRSTLGFQWMVFTNAEKKHCKEVMDVAVDEAEEMVDEKMDLDGSETVLCFLSNSSGPSLILSSI
jgi:hypothetical protein